MEDIIFPQNNEREFINIAEKLKIKDLYFIYAYKKNIKQHQNIIQKEQKNTKIKLNIGLIAKPRDIFKAKKLSNFVITKSSDKNQSISGKLQPNLIFDLESIAKKDKLHFKVSGLNQVICKLAVKNKIIIGFSFSTLLNSNLQKRTILLGRMMQNIRFCKKYKIKTFFASFAKKPFELRNKKDLKSFNSILSKKY